MSKALSLVVFCLVFAVAAEADTKPKYGPKSKPIAIPLGVANDFLRLGNHKAPDFWAMIGYYVPQISGSACSVASVAMVLNAARISLPRSADDQVVMQEGLLDKVDVAQWKQLLSKEGVNGERGVRLPILKEVAEASFKAYGFKQAQVRAVHVADSSVKTRQEVAQALLRNEASSKDFIIANFNQQSFTDDAAAGHIAPVGAYDAQRERVLILDPDREYYEPYWVSLDAFVAGMATPDSASGVNRGYVVITVGAP